MAVMAGTLRTISHSKQLPAVRLVLAFVGCLILQQSLLAHSFGDSLVVVYTGGMRGRANGCGCNSGPEGGLDRRTTLLKQQLGDASYIALDCGGILDLDPEGGMYRSKCTIRGLAREELKAIAVSSRDLFYGTKFLSDVASETGVKLLSCNIVLNADKSKSLYDRSLTISFGGREIIVTGLTLPVQPRSGIEQGSWTALAPDSIHEQLDSARLSEADLSILLTDLDEASLRRFLQTTDAFDIALTSSPQVYSATPFKIGTCIVLHPDNSGRSFEAMIVPPYGDLAGIRLIRQPISRTTPPDPETAKWLEDCLGKAPVK